MSPKYINFTPRLKSFFNAVRKNLFDSIYSLLDFSGGVIDGFLLNIMLVRYLTISDYGDYKTVFSVINILIIFSITGLNNSVAKAVAKKYRAFFFRATRISVSFSTISSAVLIALAFILYRESGIRFALLYGSALIPVYFGFNTWQPYYVASKKFKTVFISNLFIIITRLLVIFLILFYTGNYVYSFIAFIAVVTVYNFIYYFRIVRSIDRKAVDEKKDRELIKHGFRITGATVISVIAKNIERIILNAVSSSTMVGIYSIASIFPQFLKNGFKSLLNVPAVKLAYYDEKNNRRVIKKYLFFIFGSGIIVFVIFWFITPFLLRVFFDVSDPDIFMYSRLILVPIIFIPFNFIIKYMCSYQGGGQSYFKLNTSTESIKLVLLAALIPLLEIRGIVIALISSEFISFLIMLIWFLRSNRKLKVE